MVGPVDITHAARVRPCRVYSIMVGPVDITHAAHVRPCRVYSIMVGPVDIAGQVQQELLQHRRSLLRRSTSATGQQQQWSSDVVDSCSRSSSGSINPAFTVKFVVIKVGQPGQGSGFRAQAHGTCMQCMLSTVTHCPP